MIKLNVAKYCYNCPEFEAHVEKMKFDSFSTEDHCDVTKCETVITCEYSERCEAIRRHLMRNWDISESKDPIMELLSQKKDDCDI